MRSGVGKLGERKMFLVKNVDPYKKFAFSLVFH